MQLKLTFPDSSTAKITSKDHSALVFKKPSPPSSGSVGAKRYLMYMRDTLNNLDNSKGSCITFTNSTSNFSTPQITKIIDGAGRETLFSYNNDNLLQTITAPDGTSVSFEYTSAQLRRIRYSDLTGSTQYTEYTYDGDLLVSARNYDGLIRLQSNLRLTMQLISARSQVKFWLNLKADEWNIMEDFIFETEDTDFTPNLLDRVHLRCVRRDVKKVDIVWNDEGL